MSAAASSGRLAGLSVPPICNGRRPAADALPPAPPHATQAATDAAVDAWEAQLQAQGLAVYEEGAVPLSHAATAAAATDCRRCLSRLQALPSEVSDHIATLLGTAAKQLRLASRAGRAWADAGATSACLGRSTARALFAGAPTRRLPPLAALTLCGAFCDQDDTASAATATCGAFYTRSPTSSRASRSAALTCAGRSRRCALSAPQRCAAYSTASCSWTARPRRALTSLRRSPRLRRTRRACAASELAAAAALRTAAGAAAAVATSLLAISLVFVPQRPSRLRRRCTGAPGRSCRCAAWPLALLAPLLVAQSRIPAAHSCVEDAICGPLLNKQRNTSCQRA